MCNVNEARDDAYAVYSLLMITPDPAKSPAMAVHHAFDAGYDSRDAEVSRLRELLSKTLKLLSKTLVLFCYPRITISRPLYDAIQDELAQARQETTQ